MSKSVTDHERQMAAAREGMDGYREALSALAKSEAEALKDMTPEMQRKMETAKERMNKYETAYSRLAK